MDPSEFEGTVPREEGALDAGSLEQLMTGPQFANIDLSALRSDLHLSIYRLREQLTKYEEASLSQLSQEMQQQAEKVAHMREEYLQRRKQLTASVKSFTATNLLADDVQQQQQSAESQRLRSDCKLLIAQFKNEFDFLAQFAKFTEASLIGAISALQELPDPAAVTAESLQLCVRADDALGKANDQLDIADQLLNGDSCNNSSSGTDSIGRRSGTGGFGAGASAAVVKAMRAKHDAELLSLTQQAEQQEAQLKESYLSEISELRAKCDMEMRTREMNLSGNFEQQHMEQQQMFDKTLQKKDAEIRSLLQSLEEITHSNLEASERGIALDAEALKRRDIEEKWRAAVVELSDARAATQELSLQLDRAQTTAADARDEFERERKQLQELQRVERQQISELTSKLHKNSLELAARPPADLSALLEKLGSIGASFADNSQLLLSNTQQQQQQSQETTDNSRSGSNSSSSNSNSSSSTSSSSSSSSSVETALSWSEVERALFESIRRCDADATHFRVKAHETSLRAAAAEEESAMLREQLQKQTQLTAALEADLTDAHQAMQASNAAMKKQQFTFRNSKQQQQQQQQQQSESRFGSCDSNLASLIGADDVETHDFVDAATAANSEGLSESSTATAATCSGGSGVDSGRILQAVQEQRDRYLRSLRDAESDAETVRAKNERLLDEQLQLRNENLELYRRLRTLRVSNSSSSNDNSNRSLLSSSSVAAGGGGGRYAMRSRKSIAADVLEGQQRSLSAGFDDLEDPLEAKYMNLHESQISPFNVQELVNKHLVTSRLNIFERGLAFINRSILQDRWARHALLLYQALLHAFALAYVWQVLNPQLIDEVDAHLKAKWSAQTMDMPEHPDV